MNVADRGPKAGLAIDFEIESTQPLFQDLLTLAGKGIEVPPKLGFDIIESFTA